MLYTVVMQTALRKMGNSTGMIVPRSILGQIGVTTGAAMDLRVENGKLIATPIRTERRDGWASAAVAVAADDNKDGAAWRGFGNEDDAELTW
jgi:antitoxin MazE